MYKTLILMSLFAFSSGVLAFESGNYHGSNGPWSCDVNLKQEILPQPSFIWISYTCEREDGGIVFGSNDKVYDFGDYVEETQINGGVLVETGTVSEDSMRASVSMKNDPFIIEKRGVTDLKNGQIYFEYEMNNFIPFFEMILSK